MPSPPDGRVRLSGFHALKHALRFGAVIERAAAPDPAAVVALAERLAPDLVADLEALLQPEPALDEVAAIARRPDVRLDAILAARGRVVLLERPTHLGNLGAAIRVAAAAAAAAVVTTGPADPWHPQALRGAAGLQFALPVLRLDALPETDRPIVALDPQGEPLALGAVPDDAILAFGSERSGLSAALRARATRTLSIPMRRGVSSLNLATAVAVALYCGR
jgi:TrmH family RNA methyltransferase